MLVDQQRAERDLLARLAQPDLLFKRLLELLRGDDPFQDEIFAQELGRVVAGLLEFLLLLDDQDMRQGLRRQASALEQDIAQVDKLALLAAGALLLERHFELLLSDELVL